MDGDKVLWAGQKNADPLNRSASVMREENLVTLCHHLEEISLLTGSLSIYQSDPQGLPYEKDGKNEQGRSERVNDHETLMGNYRSRYVSSFKVDTQKVTVFLAKGTKRDRYQPPTID